MDKVFKCLGSTNHTEEERADLDFYATDPEAVEDLLKYESFDIDVLEPCSGAGHISEVLLKHGYKVKNLDIIDRGYTKNFVQCDFLKYDEEFKGDIITNPPFSKALEFVEHALKIVSSGSKIAMFLRIQFLEGQQRRLFFMKNPPLKVYVFSKRTGCAKNADFDNTNKAICFCWFIWKKGFNGDPVIKWI